MTTWTRWETESISRRCVRCTEALRSLDHGLLQFTHAIVATAIIGETRYDVVFCLGDERWRIVADKPAHSAHEAARRLTLLDAWLKHAAPLPYTPDYRALAAQLLSG